MKFQAITLKSLLLTLSLNILVYGLVLQKREPNQIVQADSSLEDADATFLLMGENKRTVSTLKPSMDDDDDCDDYKDDLCDEDARDDLCEEGEDSCDEKDDEYGFYALAVNSEVNATRFHHAKRHKAHKAISETTNRTLHTGFASNLISRVIEENQNSEIQDVQDESALALLWFKLASLVLPYKQTTSKIKQQFKEHKKTSLSKANSLSDKIKIKQRNLIQKNELGHNDILDLVTTKQVPSISVLNASTLLQEKEKSPEVNLTGLLSRLFGNGDDDYEDCDDVSADDDDCDDSEDYDDDCDDRYTYEDPCDFYETSFNGSSIKTLIVHHHKHNHSISKFGIGNLSNASSLSEFESGAITLKINPISIIFTILAISFS